MKNEENQLLLEANENYFVVWRKFYCTNNALLSQAMHFINDTEIPIDSYLIFLNKLENQR